MITYRNDTFESMGGSKRVIEFGICNDYKDSGGKSGFFMTVDDGVVMNRSLKYFSNWGDLAADIDRSGYDNVHYTFCDSYDQKRGWYLVGEKKAVSDEP